jgi:hypothetical protein
MASQGAIDGRGTQKPTPPESQHSAGGVTFRRLTFGNHPNHPDGKRATIFFPNGYGASVIQSRYSYGGPEGYYELAVFKGTSDEHDLCYDTPVTSDVEGWLTPRKVTGLLKRIAALPKAEGS